jgi:hypothetical protein
MADGIQIAGRVEVFTQIVNTTGNLIKLGECMDMADIEDRAFFNNISGDRHGGPQGPPIDMQYLGSIYVVRLELSRFDTAEMDKLIKRQVLATAGTIPIGTNGPGTLMLAANTFRLCLKSPTRPINFPCVLLRDSIQYSMGTKFTSMAMQFECHRCPDGTYRKTAALGSLDNGGVLYNSVVAEYIA